MESPPESALAFSLAQLLDQLLDRRPVTLDFACRQEDPAGLDIIGVLRRQLFQKAEACRAIPIRELQQGQPDRQGVLLRLPDSAQPTLEAGAGGTVIRFRHVDF